MMRGIFILLMFMMGVAYGQDLNNPSTVGQRNRNQKFNKGVQVEDTTLLKGVIRFSEIQNTAGRDSVLVTDEDGYLYQKYLSIPNWTVRPPLDLTSDSLSLGGTQAEDITITRSNDDFLIQDTDAFKSYIYGVGGSDDLLSGLGYFTGSYAANVGVPSVYRMGVFRSDTDSIPDAVMWYVNPATGDFIRSYVSDDEMILQSSLGSTEVAIEMDTVIEIVSKNGVTGDTSAVAIRPGGISTRAHSSWAVVLDNSGTLTADRARSEPDASGTYALEDYYGWAVYSDTVSTQASPQSISAGDTATVINRAHTSITSQLPTGVVRLYNETDSTIVWPQSGDAGDIRIDFSMRTSAASDYATLFVDIGASPNTPVIIVRRLLTFPKGANTWHNFSVGFPVYCLDTCFANGMKIRIHASGSGNIDIAGPIYVIKKDYNAK